MTNDQKILDLKKKIEEEKKALNEKTKFQPVTTCIIDLLGNKINLRTLSVSELQIVLTAVNALLKSADELGIDPDISGFDLEDWRYDITGILKQKEISDRKTVINKLEAKLQSMLSDEKKTELEIEEIAKMLN